MADVNMAGTEHIKAKLCKIEVPQVVLGKDDCDASLPVPNPGTWAECCSLPQPLRRLTFPVPMGSEEGCILNIPLQDGQLSKELPRGLSAGETALVVQRPDGQWRVLRKPKYFAFLLPAGATAGTAVKQQLPDGTFLHFDVPEGVGPGHLVELQSSGNSWQLKQVVELTEVQRIPAQTPTIRGPFLAALEFLHAQGLSLVPADADGMLVVNVPFCGRFQEYAMLGNFLAEHCLKMPGIKGVRVFAADSSDAYYYEWAVAKRWFAEFHPEIEVHLQVQDLQMDPLPRAGLTIALHPEVTRGGSWFQIMGSVIKASQGGVCLFAAFFQDEVATLMNMMDMYDETSREKQLVENAHWKSPVKGEQPPSKRMNFLVLVKPSKPSLAKVETSLFQRLGQLLTCICRSK